MPCLCGNHELVDTPLDGCGHQAGPKRVATIERRIEANLPHRAFDDQPDSDRCQGTASPRAPRVQPGEERARPSSAQREPRLDYAAGISHRVLASRQSDEAPLAGLVLFLATHADSQSLFRELD